MSRIISWIVLYASFSLPKPLNKRSSWMTPLRRCIVLAAWMVGNRSSKGVGDAIPGLPPVRTTVLEVEVGVCQTRRRRVRRRRLRLL
eukprot:1544484-Pyramimonas_sp.AAC.1